MGRTCKTCRETKPLSEFVRNEMCRLGRTHRCKDCERQYQRRLYHDRALKTPERLQAKRAAYKRWRSAHPEAEFTWKLRRRYGVSLQKYEAVRSTQSGRCAICLIVPDKPLHIDHCHESGAMRGLLCRKCNTGLGFFLDRPDLLQAAIDYLLKHRAEIALEIPA